MSFYITLISDSSMSYFPENKISYFITRLLIPIELKGDWEVGMVELLYPHTWYNVNEQNNLIGFETDGQLEVGRRLPPGCYKTVPDILVGDVLAPLLRVVQVRGQDGEMISEQYDRPHYLPVNRKMIETLEIVIRTHAGCLTPFERGRSYVKLHFRQKSLS